MHTTIADIRLTTVKLPFREIPRWHMMRQNPHWGYFDVFEVELSDGSVGVGTERVNWSSENESSPGNRYIDENAVSLLWDGSLRDGIQVAVFDAVGQALDVPIHKLLGEQHHDRTQLSWWCIDMSPEDWLSECETAIDRGYTSVKIKGRPWWDIKKQIDYLCEHLPEWFHIGIDFNETLRDADRAIPILKHLERYPQVHAFEGAIPYDDTEGYERIRAAVDTSIVLHYGIPPVRDQICEQLCDGFVFSGGPPTETMPQAPVAAMAEIPGFLQYVGTGISAAFALHYGAVFETATWPAVTTYELFTHPLIEDWISVEDGYAEVPDDPGLGYQLDYDAVERFATEKPTTKPNPPVLTEWHWPEDRVWAYLTSNRQTGHAKNPPIPFYQPGARARRVPDDGSDTWREIYNRADEDEPYVVYEDPFS